MTDQEQRFDGLAQLLGGDASARLRRAHACVVGLGGVGSWAAEALARSGVGRITLVDPDVVCVTNTNRQAHALDPTVGQLKVEAMAARVRMINPDLRVDPIPARFEAETAARILATSYDCLVDAIDDAANKCRLIAGCRQRQIPIVISGGAGGRVDPTRVRVDDLAFTSHDRLLAQVRASLRADYGFPRGQTAFGVPCVHSTEPPGLAPESSLDGSAQNRAQPLPGAPRGGYSNLGTAVFVTGVFGFTLAALAVRRIAAATARAG